MNFEGLVRNTYPINVVRPYESVRNIRVNLPNSPDRVSLNGTLDKYMDRNTLLSIVQSNPEIQRILAEKGIPLNINIEGFQKNVYNHSVDTKNTAIGIYNNLPNDKKSSANIKTITDGAILHDLGKILIPENILTKRSKLTPKEADIMHAHSTLSYELLKSQGIDNNTLKIIKYHHQNPSHTGYPQMSELENIGIDNQIVSLADKYSALREKRSYKPQMNEQQALNILYNEMNNGVSPDIYKALERYVTTKGKNNTATLANYLDTKNASPQINRSSAFYA